VPPPAAIVSVRRFVLASALTVPLIPTFPSFVTLSVVIVTLLASVRLLVNVTLFAATSAVVIFPVSVVVPPVTARLASGDVFPTAAPNVTLAVPALIVRLRGVASELTVALPAAGDDTAPPAPVEDPAPPFVAIVTFAVSVVGS